MDLCGETAWTIKRSTSAIACATRPLKVVPKIKNPCSLASLLMKFVLIRETTVSGVKLTLCLLPRWAAHDPAPHVSARLSSALLSIPRRRI